MQQKINKLSVETKPGKQLVKILLDINSKLRCEEDLLKFYKINKPNHPTKFVKHVILMKKNQTNYLKKIRKNLSNFF